MKLALIFLPKDGEMSLSVENSEKPPRIFIFRRCKQLMLLTTALMAAMAMSAIAVLVSQNVGNGAVAVAEKPAEGVRRSQCQWRVSQYNPTQSLKRGNNVVLHRDGVSRVWQVAASANSSVLLNRGEATESFYMVGDNLYVVISDRDSKVVRANEILAVVEPAGVGQR
jgi:hypothetical protein